MRQASVRAFKAAGSTIGILEVATIMTAIGAGLVAAEFFSRLPSLGAGLLVGGVLQIGLRLHDLATRRRP
jgi:predicted phage tail protein